MSHFSAMILRLLLQVSNNPLKHHGKADYLNLVGDALKANSQQLAGMKRGERTVGHGVYNLMEMVILPLRKITDVH